MLLVLWVLLASGALVIVYIALQAFIRHIESLHMEKYHGRYPVKNDWKVTTKLERDLQTRMRRNSLNEKFYRKGK